jgi:type I restriction enzyme S subunit
LDEEKQAIVFRAVTRGTAVAPALKSSGLPWVEKIPESWDLIPNRAFLSLKKEVAGEENNRLTLLSLTLRGIIARDMDNPTGKWPSDFSTYQRVHSGDLVFCLFDIDETPRFVGYSEMEGMITGAYTVFGCKDAPLAKWAHLFYLAMDFHKRLKPVYTGLRKVIPKGTFLGLKLPTPPLDERRKILSMVANQSCAIDHAITRLRHEIHVLREYRVRLTADVVTGKLDVRGADVPEVEGVPEEFIAEEAEELNYVEEQGEGLSDEAYAD